MLIPSFVEGQHKDVALIVAGTHGGELSGIEVALWVRVLLNIRVLKENRKPYFSTYIVPEVFPDLAKKARATRSDSDDALGNFRLRTVPKGAKRVTIEL